ncbi:MAG: hypothetical protein ACYST2_06665 [Planctomycetota bacterium]|jgi:hypothetical protein
MSGKEEKSEYQKSVISSYYKNLDAISLGRLEGLVSELYLAGTERKKEQLWGRVEKAMRNLGVPKSIAEHILKRRDVEILAKNLQDWLKKK